MIIFGQMSAYFSTDAIKYTCISGYSQRIEKHIFCICDAVNADDWTCTIEDDKFENECEKG